MITPAIPGVVNNISDVSQIGPGDFELNPIRYETSGMINDIVAREKSARSVPTPDFTVPDAEILLVEDNETSLIAALGLLRPARMHIDTAENGKVALQMIEDKQYHIIFMDYMMPVMNGVEAARCLRLMDGDYFKTVPVIALTGAEESGDRGRLLQAGMNDVIAKPVERKDLFAALRRWLPAELLHEQAETTERETEPLETLPTIEGIDAREGVRYSGSKGLFISSLGDFYKLIDMKAAKIEKSLADGLLRDITVEVHALKNTARMIGAKGLSEAFYRLERYGNEENREALIRETPAVLEQYRLFKPRLKAFGKTDASNKKAASREQLAFLLRELRSAMDSFDLDGAEAALKRLDAMQIPAGCQTQMEELRAYVADVSMEGVIRAVDAMLISLKIT